MVTTISESLRDTIHEHNHQRSKKNMTDKAILVSE